MSFLSIKRKAQSQPHDAAPLDPSHWAYKDIVFAYSAGRGLQEAKQQNVGSFVGTMSYGAGIKGRNIQTGAASSYAQFPDRAKYNTLAGVTLIALVRPSSVSGQMTIVTKDAAGGGSDTPFGLLLDTGGVVSLNRANTGGGAPFVVWDGVAGIAAGQLAVVAATQGADISVAPKFYIDGVFDPTTPAPLFGGSGTGAPTSTTATVKIGLNSAGGNRFLGEIYDVYVIEREYTAAQVVELSHNLWAPWKAQPRRLYLVSSAITLVGANSSQANAGSSGAITQTHVLSGANSSQANTSATGAITQAHVLVGANSSQADTASTGAISQTHVLVGANSAQADTSATGVITQTHVLVGSNSAQANTSGTGAITQGGVFVAANCSQANSSSTGSITQTHVLAGANSSQANASSTGAISQGALNDLVAANSAQANTSGTGAITQTHVLVCAASVQDNIASASAIVQAHILAAADGSQANTSSVGAITIGVAEISSIVERLTVFRSTVSSTTRFQRNKSATVRFN